MARAAVRIATKRWNPAAEAIDALSARVSAGEALTLLCSSACHDPDRCHPTLC
jgi:hypothetical protein